MTNEYSALVKIAKAVNPKGFSVSKADRDNRDWHFAFKRHEDAGEFSYRVRCNGFQTTLNVHGDVWVKEKKDDALEEDH